MNFKNAIKSLALLLVVLVFSSCEKDDDESNDYTVPTTYTFTNAEGASTVSFSGQTQRLNMLAEMTTYMKTANTVGTTLDAMQLKKMYANDGFTWTDADKLGLTGSSKQLKSKTAGADAGIQAMFEGYMNDIAALSAQNQANADETYGVGGVWTNGTKSYLQSAKGVEYTQLIEKGLMCAVFMNQMTANYLVAVKNDDNETIAEGKTYTDMQHHWDEAYGYFTSATDYPASGTDRFWGKYTSKLEETLGSATKIATAFRTGRAAIDNKDYTMRDTQAEIIFDEMERVAAATAIHYLNEAKANITNPTVLNHTLSEAYAFTNGLRFGQKAIVGTGMTPAEIDQAVSYIGDDFANVTLENLNKAIDLIASKTGLEAEKAQL